MKKPAEITFNCCGRTLKGELIHVLNSKPTKSADILIAVGRHGRVFRTNMSKIGSV